MRKAEFHEPLSRDMSLESKLSQGFRLVKTTKEGEKVFELRPSEEQLAAEMASSKKAEQEFIDRAKKIPGAFNPPEKGGIEL